MSKERHIALRILFTCSFLSNLLLAACNSSSSQGDPSIQIFPDVPIPTKDDRNCPPFAVDVEKHNEWFHLGEGNQYSMGSWGNLVYVLEKSEENNLPVWRTFSLPQNDERFVVEYSHVIQSQPNPFEPQPPDSQKWKTGISNYIFQQCIRGYIYVHNELTPNRRLMFWVQVESPALNLDEKRDFWSKLGTDPNETETK